MGARTVLSEVSYVRSASREAADPDALLPPHLHPHDHRAAAALLAGAVESTVFSATLVVRRLDPDREPVGRLHVRADHRGVWVALSPDPTPREQRDPVTGLPGRGLVVDRLDHALDETIRSGLLAGVVHLDLDHWGRVCDAMGVEAADTVLCEVVRRLEDAIRPGDTLAHLGGDDLVVVLPGLVRPTDALRAAERMRAAVAAPLDGMIGVAASAGVAVGDSSDTPRALLDGADEALWSAKAAGRDRVELHRHADG